MNQSISNSGNFSIATSVPLNKPYVRCTPGEGSLHHTIHWPGCAVITVYTMP